MRPFSIPTMIRSASSAVSRRAALAVVLGAALVVGQGGVLAVSRPEVAKGRGGPGAAERVRTLLNPTPIVGPDQGPASPYPSTIEVAGLGGTILDVDLFLNGLESESPVDLDIILVGPQGDDAVVMSDTGGAGSPRVNLVLDDESFRSLPDGSEPLESGAFRPTDLENDDDFPPPAPLFVFDTALSEFDGTDPNGTWSLFVVDDAAGSAARLNDGWGLEITTAAQPVARDDAFGVRAGKTLRGNPPGVLANDRDPDDEDLAARLVSGPRHGKLGLKPDGSFVYRPDRRFVGTDSFVYEARDESGLADRAKVTVEVTD